MKISELINQSLGQVLAGIKGGQGRLGGSAIAARLNTSSGSSRGKGASASALRSKGDKPEEGRFSRLIEKGLLLNDSGEFFGIVEFDIPVMAAMGTDGKEDLVVAGEKNGSDAVTRVRFSIPVQIPAP